MNDKNEQNVIYEYLFNCQEELDKESLISRCKQGVNRHFTITLCDF